MDNNSTGQLTQHTYGLKNQENKETEEKKSFLVTPDLLLKKKLFFELKKVLFWWFYSEKIYFLEIIYLLYYITISNKYTKQNILNKIIPATDPNSFCGICIENSFGTHSFRI